MNNDLTYTVDLKLSPKDFAVVDLFCGVGGLTRGLIDENLTVSAGIDFDETCEYAYHKNNSTKFVHKDISELSAEELISFYPTGKQRILVGCAPCQPFSNHSNRIRKSRQEKAQLEVQEDKKWKLLYEFLRLIRETNPVIISMENVPQLRNHKVFDDFVAGLKALNYHISDYKTPVFCPDYGVPQKRLRLVLLASKLGPIEMIPAEFDPESYPTVYDVIGEDKLASLVDGEVSAEDPLHRARKLSPINLRRIKSLKQGENWTKLDSDLISPCHKKENGKTFTVAYGRMRWNEQAPTITTHCIGFSNGRFGHPVQNRAISLREAALLQSFPSKYDFIEDTEKMNVGTLARHIGNAVPPKLGAAIARSIKRHIDGYGK
ncbi:MAG: DNA cytosine methyltransferase [Cytophagales bacterium]|nr:MAG: DNA cytosine methyltransferase [Cytophagales bacterium]